MEINTKNVFTVNFMITEVTYFCDEIFFHTITNIYMIKHHRHNSVSSTAVGCVVIYYFFGKGLGLF